MNRNSIEAGAISFKDEEKEDYFYNYDTSLGSSDFFIFIATGRGVRGYKRLVFEEGARVVCTGNIREVGDDATGTIGYVAYNFA